MNNLSIEFTNKLKILQEEVFNVPGDACLNLTEDIELKLGDVEKRTYTIDYYQNQNIQKDVTLQYNQNNN